jgi:uncharacterized protein (DUF1330 family)
MTDVRDEPPRYGAINFPYVSTWDQSPSDEPMWALNLMHYRERADYRDGRPSTLSGREADDRYSPFGPLSEVGARIVLVAEVVEQLAGQDVQWDRVAVVRYPSRQAMLDMQRLPSFQDLHAHKEAGMASTIVAATFPRPGPASVGAVDNDPASAPQLVLQLIADDKDPAIHVADAAFSATFDVEGVIIGDDRTWARAQWDALSDPDLDAFRAALMAKPTHDERYVVVLAPLINELAQSLSLRRRADEVGD